MFSYAEKAEYLAFVWGTVVMAASGFILWFNNWSLRNLPKWVSDAATALHCYEAILATAAIVVWHFYMVIFDPDVYPMDLSWITGKGLRRPPAGDAARVPPGAVAPEKGQRGGPEQKEGERVHERVEIRAAARGGLRAGARSS